MEEKLTGRGGPNRNQGRKKKTVIENVINLLDEHIDQQEVLEALLKKIKAGDTKAITLYFNYRFGRAIQTINQTNSFDANIDIKKMFGFDDNDKDEK